MALSSCFGSNDEFLEALPAQEMYQLSKDEWNAGDEEQAYKILKELRATYPSSVYAKQALLDLSYYNFEKDTFADAVAYADSFISIYPSNQNVDYALYIKGHSLIKEQGLFLRVIGSSDKALRSPDGMREALDVFIELVERFPNSLYAQNAHELARYAINQLAKHELAIGYFYYERGLYNASIARGQHIINTYEDSLAVEEALLLIAHSYRQLGLEDSEKNATSVLFYNFPDNPYPENALFKLEQ